MQKNKGWDLPGLETRACKFVFSSCTHTGSLVNSRQLWSGVTQTSKRSTKNLRVSRWPCSGSGRISQAHALERHGMSKSPCFEEGTRNLRCGLFMSRVASEGIQDPILKSECSQECEGSWAHVSLQERLQTQQFLNRELLWERWCFCTIKHTKTSWEVFCCNRVYFFRLAESTGQFLLEIRWQINRQTDR